MPTRTIQISADLDDFISQHIANGRYRDADDLMTAALLTLRCEENDYEEKLSALKVAIEEGLNGGVVEGDVFEQVRTEIGLPLRKSA